MDESEKQITSLIKDITDFKDKQEAFVKEMAEKYHIHFDPTPESIETFRGILREETNGFKNETRKCTFAELQRLKKAYGDEEDNINVLRICWWPHGYLLVLIFELLFCSDLFLILKLMGKL